LKIAHILKMQPLSTSILLKQMMDKFAKSIKSSVEPKQAM